MSHSMRRFSSLPSDMRRRIPRPPHRAWHTGIRPSLPHRPPTTVAAFEATLPRTITTSPRWNLPRSNSSKSTPAQSFEPVVTRPHSIPAPHSLDEAALSFLPQAIVDNLDPQFRDLQAQLFASFLPSNQRLPSKRSRQMPSLPPGSTMMVLPAASRDTIESVPEGLSLVSPFEGGDFYISDALSQVAATLSADVQRIDLTLALGFHGDAAPLGSQSAPPIEDDVNPLLQSAAETDAVHEPLVMEEEDDEHQPKIGVMRVPLAVMGPAGLQMGLGETRPFAPPDDKWIQFFSRVLQLHPPSSPVADSSKIRKRIVLLESTSEMASTFEIWYNSLLEALALRRADQLLAKSSRSRQAELVFPTTVVLSCSASLLPAHFGMPSHASERAEAPVQTAAKIGIFPGKLEDGQEDSVHWGGGDELNTGARERRDRNRLELLRENGPAALLPLFSPRVPQHPSGLLDILHGRKNTRTRTASLTRAVLPILSDQRDLVAEEAWRRHRRKLLNVALMAKALSLLGSKSELDPQDVQSWDDTISTWNYYEQLAARATCLRHDITQPIDWSTLEKAMEAEEAGRQLFSRALEHHLPDQPRPLPASRKMPKENLIDVVKSSKSLSSHEKRLLSCVVDRGKLDNTSFNDVILPEKTIDAIRTVVSLPLLYPAAFRTGILKENATQGALFFGPPGTGKTMLARAVASESDARMISVQPSDINSMYVGEGEKAVKSLFNLAKKLAPCVVFVDECDILFSSRMSRDSGGGGRAHNAIVSTFLEEMDGLQAHENREKGIIVIGATNRPFDIDEAALRRLPRRLLIDLPDAAGRKSILQGLLRAESLDQNVDLDELVRRTEGYSGSDLKHICVNAALCAVKETLHLPWKTSASDTVLEDEPLATSTTEAASEVAATRVLQWRHFKSALKDIRGSASEESIPEMRKWATAFGEGFAHRRSGFGRGFGFSEKVTEFSPVRVSEQD